MSDDVRHVAVSLYVYAYVECGFVLILVFALSVSKMSVKIVNKLPQQTPSRAN